ncbi:hypothetical protein GQ53DRAFT_756798 [Thozetella sp. PMI_491]|nr:hypothetical protein GQ53DRAFT_756798 [Thozetella sp. PMI_491]
MDHSNSACDPTSSKPCPGPCKFLSRHFSRSLQPGKFNSHRWDAASRTRLEQGNLIDPQGLLARLSLGSYLGGRLADATEGDIQVFPQTNDRATVGSASMALHAAQHIIRGDVQVTEEDMEDLVAEDFVGDTHWMAVEDRRQRPSKQPHIASQFPAEILGNMQSMVRRPKASLHAAALQVALGQEISVADRMDLHLL